jgi:prepilin-type processing-associated H-X9-DG protein
MKRLAVAVLFLLALPGLVHAQEGGTPLDYAALLSGERIPLTVKLKDLDASWRRFTPAGGQDMSASLASLYGLSSGTFYTKGETVTVQVRDRASDGDQARPVARETYLIAYAPPSDRTAIYAIMAGEAEGESAETTGETALTLALLNVRTMGSLTDIRPFNLEAELAAFAASQAALQRRRAGRVEETDDPSLSSLRNIALAVQMFLADYDDKLPAMDTPEAFRAALEEYVSSDDVFKDEAGDYYGLNASLNGKSLTEIADPAQIVLAYQTTAQEDGTRGVAFLDGHVRRVSGEEWEKLKAASGIE